MTSSLERVARTFLRKTARLHEAMVTRAMRLEKAGDDEKTLRWIRLTAEIAWAAHGGRLSDERLEAIAVRIGQQLEALPANSSAPDARHEVGGRRHVLHVATTVIGVGGHTRLIENWVKADDSSRHSLLLIDQGAEAIRARLSDRIVASGGGVTVLPRGATSLERARQLRRAVRSGYDCVILHHHPNDVVPLVAFATDDCPPVAVMNHADHVFWLGVSIADLVVEYRQFGAELSRQRRAIRRAFLFPLPLDVQSPIPGREEARKRLNIAEAEQVLLTMGPASKYVPTKTQRFFDAMSEVLDRHPNASLYAVGVSESDIVPLEIVPHPRMKLLGVLTDPSDYQAAADLYLEGFPFGSYTALLETAARGICPVLMHSATEHNDMSGEATLNTLVQAAPDLSCYLAEIDRLLADPEERVRRGRIIAQRIGAHHGAEASRRYVQQIYSGLATLHHKVEPLPDRVSQAARHDLDLAGFQSSRMKIPAAEWLSAKTVLDLALGELLRLFALSVQVGDTRLRPRHAKAWVSMIKRRMLRRAP